MRSHRLLPFATLFTLALTTIATGANAQSQSVESTLPYVYSHNTFPSERASIARHTLRFAVPADSKSVSAVKLTAPAGFKLNQKVAVFDAIRLRGHLRWLSRDRLLWRAANRCDTPSCAQPLGANFNTDQSGLCRYDGDVHTRISHLQLDRTRQAQLAIA